MYRRITLLALGLVLLAGCARMAALQYDTANNDVQELTLQRPLTPEQTLTRLVVPEGFEARVFAAEPDIANPIALAWDEAGRLWVVESTNYPHESVGAETGTDRITICEDTDGDYKADTFIRFAENQPLTTAITIVKGGALVGQAPDIVFLEDTDGDDRADRKTVVIDDAFGTFDTHAVMNNMKLGIDNHVWGAVGYSGMYTPGSAPEAEARILGRGVFRFNRDGAGLEPVGEFNNNTWGLGIGEDNTIFGSTANNNHAVVVGIPMRYETEKNVANVQSHYLVAHGSERALQQVDFRDGYTAAAGAFPYAGRQYPEEYWGALMVTEPTAHVVHSVYLEPDGAIYREQEGAIDNVLESSDDWVAPVFADIGPDENIWVADWYNPVIQHNPDRRGMVNQIWNANAGSGNAHLNPLRDRQHGRIYVLAYTGRESDGPESLSAEDTDGLLGALQSTNQFWRLTAQRLIVENGLDDLVPGLLALIQDESTDATGLNAGAVHALWTLHGLGAIEGAIQEVRRALRHPSAAVRKAAIAVLPADAATGEALAEAGVFTDANLNTRLSAVLRVIDLGDDASASVVAATQAAREGADEWIEMALDKLHLVPEEEEATIAQAFEPDALPMARLTLHAPPGVMRFEETTLRAFAGQPIMLVFKNLHTEPHNAVFLPAGFDVDMFGRELDAYMTDPKAIGTEYIPPAAADWVLASTGVIGLDETVTITIDGLPEGAYTFLCSVPGHWAVMQGVLQIVEAPALPRNDAGWTWEAVNDSGLPGIVYLGGSMSTGRQSHHHARVFGFADGQVLYGQGTRTFTYTEAADEAFVQALDGAGLLAMANNKPVADAEAREAIFAHVEGGGSLLLTHPASWYNWGDWEAYNRKLVGGGSRSHEALGSFTVEIVQPNHPIMRGVPASFDVVDELYRAELNPDAEAMVLAIGRSKSTDAVYPVVWARRKGEATIVVNTLGHDDRVHNLSAYKQILANARVWLLGDE